MIGRQMAGSVCVYKSCLRGSLSGSPTSMASSRGISSPPTKLCIQHKYVSVGRLNDFHSFVDAGLRGNWRFIISRLAAFGCGAGLSMMVHSFDTDTHIYIYMMCLSIECKYGWMSMERRISINLQMIATSCHFQSRIQDSLRHTSKRNGVCVCTSDG